MGSRCSALATQLAHSAGERLCDEVELPIVSTETARLGAVLGNGPQARPVGVHVELVLKLRAFGVIASVGDQDRCAIWHPESIGPVNRIAGGGIPNSPQRADRAAGWERTRGSHNSRSDRMAMSCRSGQQVGFRVNSRADDFPEFEILMSHVGDPARPGSTSAKT